MKPIIDVGSRRELLWDDDLIDERETTATLELHHPQAREVVLEHDEAWEGDNCIYRCVVEEDGFYRMYYLGAEFIDPDTEGHAPHPIVVCYAESKDGKKWFKPQLGICEFQGSRNNNILLDERSACFDNFSVFKDPNPDCPAEERYKGIGLDIADSCLWCFTSGDGIHFRKAWPMTNEGKFDTLNVAFWDEVEQSYICYIRDFHDVPGEDLNAGVRDIRWMASTDFHHWTTPVMLDYGDSEVYPLYTNVIQRYTRAPHMRIGFPSRYVEKKAWTPNFDQFAGPEGRRRRMKIHPRVGLTVTDCVFMSSRDGRRWRRWDEAFLRPGPEREHNWVYGDCYPGLGMIETEGEWPDGPRELSLYVLEDRMSRPAMPRLRRHTIRVDGFVSYTAGYTPCRLVTKPFRFAGRQLTINFATSAIGYVRIRLARVEETDGEEEDGGAFDCTESSGMIRSLESIELFGDRLDKVVVFEQGEVGSLAGMPVRMEVTMRDAELYAFQFHL